MVSPGEIEGISPRPSDPGRDMRERKKRSGQRENNGSKPDQLSKSLETQVGGQLPGAGPVKRKMPENQGAPLREAGGSGLGRKSKEKHFPAKLTLQAFKRKDDRFGGRSPGRSRAKETRRKRQYEKFVRRLDRGERKWTP